MAAPGIDISSLERPLKYRKRRRSYSSAGRVRDDNAISIRSELEAEDWKTLTDFQLQIANATLHPDDALEEFAIHEDMFRLYLLMVAKRVTIPPVVQLATIFVLNDIPENCGTDYRFRTRADMRRAMTCLRLPDNIKLPNGQYVGKELAFIYFIRRLASVCTVNNLITMGFGRDPPFWGRVFKWMATHIAATLGYKLEPENVSFFADRFDDYAEAIRKKVNDRHSQLNPGAAPLFPQAGSFLVFAFIDGNCTGTCTPGTGPAHSGPGAPRNPNHDAIQQAFYTGWLHEHGIKHLTVDGPDGLSLFCWGPASMRRNDLYLLANSGANEEVHQAQAHVVPQTAVKVMYGDSIFPWRTCLRSRYHASANDPHKIWKDHVDKALSSSRECVEHHYGEADLLWPFMAYEAKLKIGNMNLGELYTAKMLLRNFYVCLYGNKTSERFGCRPMELEEYAA